MEDTRVEEPVPNEPTISYVEDTRVEGPAPCEPTISYYLLFTATSFVGDPAWVSEVFRPPDLRAALSFAPFILKDPPTSPVIYRDQTVFAVIVAAASYAISEWMGAVYYPLAGVLPGNV